MSAHRLRLTRPDRRSYGEPVNVDITPTLAGVAMSVSDIRGRHLFTLSAHVSDGVSPSDLAKAVTEGAK